MSWYSKHKTLKSPLSDLTPFISGFGVPQALLSTGD